MSGGPIFWEVVEEHLDEAEFLWTQWESALVAPDHTLGEVNQLVEERLLAQVDGLVSGGARVAERLLVPALGEEDPARRTAAAFALLASGERAGLDAVMASLLVNEDTRRTSLRALGLCEGRVIDDALIKALGAGDPQLQAAALSGLSFRRTDTGSALAALRADDDPALVCAALDAAWASGHAAYQRLAVEALDSTLPAVRTRAIAAGLLLGAPEAWSACRRWVRSGDEGGLAGAEPLPLLFAAVLGDARDIQELEGLANVPSLRRGVLWALGYSGRVGAAEACLAFLEDDEVGALAGEAFAAITGLPGEPGLRSRVVKAEPVEPISLEKENLSANLVPGAEAALPRFDRAAVEAWWGANRSRLHRGRRFLRGAPLQFAAVADGLANGSMRRRRGLAIELAIRSRGRSWVEAGALTGRQMTEVGRLQPVADEVFEKGFGDFS